MIWSRITLESQKRTKGPHWKWSKRLQAITRTKRFGAQTTTKNPLVLPWKTFLTEQAFGDSLAITFIVDLCFHFFPGIAFPSILHPVGWKRRAYRCQIDACCTCDKEAGQVFAATSPAFWTLHSHQACISGGTHVRQLKSRCPIDCHRSVSSEN